MKNRSSSRPSGTSLSERVTRGDVFQLGCPSREIMRHITSRWGVLVLIALQGGTHRFSALRRRVSGISERMLAQTLQWLEADNLVDRRAFAVVPPHVEYTLTPLGSAAAERVAALADWIEANVGELAAVEARDTGNADEQEEDRGTAPASSVSRRSHGG